MSGLLDRLAVQAIGAGQPVVRAVAAVRTRAPLGPADAADAQEGRFDVVAQRVSIGDGTPERTDHGTRTADRAAAVDDPARPLSAATVGHGRGPPRPHADLGAQSPAMQTAQESVANLPSEARDRGRPFPSARLETRAAVSQRTARPAAAPEAPAGRRGERDAEPAELHVHIGRIDVTGVDAPLARKRPAPKRGQRSLEDYLAGRGRGGQR
jgi:hypothetical protein